MEEVDRRAFARLFAAVVDKGLGHPLTEPLAEAESKHLSHVLEESTGLVVGWRSIKNYAAFLLKPTQAKPENPSAATLDTLARYVLNVPATTETERQLQGGQAVYWFRYREQVATTGRTPQPTNRKRFLTGLGVGLVLLGIVGAMVLLREPVVQPITDEFQALDAVSLRKRGWFLQSPNLPYWNRRNEQPGQLTLFTLLGDSWQQTGRVPRIQNLLLRTIPADCFRAEVHFSDFVPRANWQQAGLVILEDTLFARKSIRLSLAYNDFFGGYSLPGEILIQAVASQGKESRHLEEFVHQPLFRFDRTSDPQLLHNNLKNVAFRVEKQGNTFRILYSASPLDNFSFKQVATYEFAMKPTYIGLFALKGFVDTTAVVPVAVRFFQLDKQPCH